MAPARTSKNSCSRKATEVEDLLTGIDKRVPIELKRINNEWYFLCGHPADGLIGTGTTPRDAILSARQVVQNGNLG